MSIMDYAIAVATLIALAVIFWLAMRRRDRLWAEHRAAMDARQAEHDRKMDELRARYR